MVKQKRIEDFTKEEQKIYDRGREDYWDINEQMKQSVDELYKNAYKQGYTDAKLGRKRIPHDTEPGWCCACKYDIGTFKEKIKEHYKS
jgi:hypothetical protein